MTSVSLTGTNHTDDQPIHLRVIKTREYMRLLNGASDGKGNAAAGAGVAAVGTETELEDSQAGKTREVTKEEERRRQHVSANVANFAGLLGRACPAGVYEYVDVEDGAEFAAQKAGKGEGSGGKKLVINSQVAMVLTFFFGN